jgi:integrase
MLSLASLLDLYLGQRADLRSLPAQRAAFARHVIPALGATTVTELRRSEIAFMLDRVSARAGPVMADRTLSYLRAALNWYEARTDDWRSPVVRGMVRTGARERTRVLDDAELRKVWAATADGAPFARFIRVLLLTGQRRGEVAGMSWAELSGGLWTIPGARYKAGQAHLIPLSAHVLPLLGARQRGPYVFSTTGGRRPVSGFGKALAGLQARSGTNGWRLHDLRRTVRTRMAALRVPHAVAELVLGHGKRGLARVYDQHSYLPEMREALAAWATELERIVAERKAKRDPN